MENRRKRNQSSKRHAKLSDEGRVPPLVPQKPICRKLALLADYRNKLPFTRLSSRHATAVIMSFFGDKSEVSKLLQRLSHTTRAFFVNAKQLKGFLLNCGATAVLKSASEAE